MSGSRTNQGRARHLRRLRHAVAKVRAKRQVTVPEDVARVLGVREGDDLVFSLNDAGDVVVRGTTTIPADQRWFWDPDWQAGEREASAQITNGELTTYADVDDMFQALDR